MNIVKPWKIKRNAKGYVVKCENKRNAKNSPWILGNLRIQETFYVIKNLQGANKMNSHCNKNVSQNYLFWTWCINLAQSNLSGSFRKTLFMPNSSLHKFAIRHFQQQYIRNSSRKFFLSKISDLSKNIE